MAGLYMNPEQEAARCLHLADCWQHLVATMPPSASVSSSECAVGSAASACATQSIDSDSSRGTQLQSEGKPLCWRTDRMMPICCAAFVTLSCSRAARSRTDLGRRRCRQCAAFLPAAGLAKHVVEVQVQVARIGANRPAGVARRPRLAAQLCSHRRQRLRCMHTALVHELIAVSLEVLSAVGPDGRQDVQEPVRKRTARLVGHQASAPGSALPPAASSML